MDQLGEFGDDTFERVESSCSRSSALDSQLDLQVDRCEEGKISVGEVSGSNDTVEVDVIICIPTGLTFRTKIVIWKTQADGQVSGAGIVDIRYLV